MFNQVWRWAGRYRTTDKNLGRPWPQVPESVRQLCEDAAFWIEHQTYAWDELGARVHHRLVSIHPFANGNGRHARLLTDVLLQSHGVPLFTWGSETMVETEKTREAYLTALRAADGQDLGPLMAFVRS